MGLGLEGTLDTNILLRFLLADNAQQYRVARALIEKPKLLHVSVLTIAEIVFVLEGKGFTRHEIKQNIEALSAYRNLYMSRAIIMPAAELYAKHPSLSFIDACLAYEAAQESAEPLYTFDKKLARQAPHTRLVTVSSKTA
jgi:predicted nucleic-acid-binding protein